jgi:hypothetical protein
MMNKKKIVSLLLVGALIALPVCAQAATGGITGSVTSAGNAQGKVTLSLLHRGGTQAVQTVTVAGNSGSYVMEGVEQGLYTLKASKYNHVTREYEVVVTEDGTLVQDVKLCLQGDVTGDGRINVGDSGKAYSHVRKISLLTDAYAQRCADMNGDSKINVGDVGKIYALVRNPGSSTEIPPLPANPVEDNKEEPTNIGGTLNFDAEVDAGHLAYFNLYRISGTSLTIENPMAYVIYNGTTYEAEDGKVTVPELYSDSTNTPALVAIGNRGTEDLIFPVTLSYPQGHRMNPIPLSNGNLSTFCEAGNDQGVYYSFTATQAGTLTIRLTQAADCNISITSDIVEGGTRSVSLSDNPDSTSLSFKMSAGETVSVCIGMNPVNGYNYPEGTISTTVRFR